MSQTYKKHTHTRTYTRARTDTNVSDILSYMFIVTQPDGLRKPGKGERVDKNYCYDGAYIISSDLAGNAGNAVGRGGGRPEQRKSSSQADPLMKC